MRHGADWYQREPVAYLGGVQGLTAREHAVYSVVLDLIYLHGGSINNDPGWVAGWISDMGSHAVRKAILSLVDRGKLSIEEDQITQKRAKTQAKTKENVRETRRESGKKGGINSGKSRRESIENNKIDEASASTREEKRREEGNSSSEELHKRSFEAFWRRWPVKIAKQDAFKAWKKLKLEDRREAYFQCQTWFESWRMQHPKASPIHPSTFLNQKRWNDEMPKMIPIEGGRHDRTSFDAKHREYARRVGQGEIDFGPDEGDPFAGG